MEVPRLSDTDSDAKTGYFVENCSFVKGNKYGIKSRQNTGAKVEHKSFLFIFRSFPNLNLLVFVQQRVEGDNMT